MAQNVTGIVRHELDHSMGLLHGGRDKLNGKPNYRSFMNYAYGSDLDFGLPENDFGGSLHALNFLRSRANWPAG